MKAASSFETRSCGALLSMRPGGAVEPVSTVSRKLFRRARSGRESFVMLGTGRAWERCRGFLPDRSQAKLCVETRSNLVVAVSRMHFKILHPGLAQSFFFDGIPRCRRALVMTVALIFDGEDRPAASVDDKNVGPLAVDRTMGVIVSRFENLAKAGLRKDPVSVAHRCYLVLDDPEDTILAAIHDLLFLKRGGHHRIELLCGVCQVEAVILV